MSFQVSTIGTEIGKLPSINGNCEGNQMETVSLKALANKVLQRNVQGNLMETSSFQAGKTEGVKVSAVSIEEIHGKPTKQHPVKLYSETLQSFLWVVETDQDMHTLRAQNVPEAIYTGRDIEQLKNVPKAMLKTIHAVKEAFPMATIEEIQNKTKSQ